MKQPHDCPLNGVLPELLGPRAWAALREGIAVPRLRSGAPPGSYGAAEVALALALTLFDDLCARVPLARAYAHECAASRRPLVFDHGAMRTVAAPSGALPAGRRAVARLLEPLGYVATRRYPLASLGMTGHVYSHRAQPADLPQYFVSELHPERLSPEVARAAEGLLATSVDPLGPWAAAQLVRLAGGAFLSRAELLRLIPALVACFARHHREPTLAEYELFAGESAELAWIATEGHSFNHITDRVDDVEQVALRQRELGRPVKEAVEVSESGRVRQTALRAAYVERVFAAGDRFVTRIVPGSFLEFISRQPTASGELDLAFDAQNAQGIFKMTDAGVSRG
ncbi:MAG: DUF1338 family protein [Planctomycetota bacterium]